MSKEETKRDSLLDDLDGYFEPTRPNETFYKSPEPSEPIPVARDSQGVPIFKIKEDPTTQKITKLTEDEIAQQTSQRIVVNIDAKDGIPKELIADEEIITTIREPIQVVDAENQLAAQKAAGAEAQADKRVVDENQGQRLTEVDLLMKKSIADILSFI